MKVLLVNGSPHANRCTYTALLKMAKVLIPDFHCEFGSNIILGSYAENHSSWEEHGIQSRKTFIRKATHL